MASQNLISILIQAKDEASKVIKSLGDNTGKAGQDAEKSGGMFSGMWKQVAVGELAAHAVEKGFELVKDQFGETLAAAQEQQQVMSQLNAVLTSTGHAAGMSANDIEDLAKHISNTTPIENDSALAAENMLLTFTNIKKTQFGGATQAVVDMATAMNGGATPAADQLRQTAIQVGKALNDPIDGLTKLQKVGVTFTDDQKKQIQTMEAAGNMAGAQAVMVAELNREFGGSGAAALKTWGGQVENIKNKMHDMREEIGVALTDALTPFLTKAATFVTTLDWDSIIQTVGAAFYDLADGLTTAINTAVKFGEMVGKAIAPQLAGIWNGLKQLMPTLEQLWHQIIQPLMVVLGVAFVIALKAVLEGINLLLPVINAIGQAILATTHFFEQHKLALAALIGVVAALGAAMLAAIIPPAIAAVVAFGAMVAGAVAAAAATVLAFLPIVIIGAIVAGVIYEIVTHWKEISKVAKDVWAAVQKDTKIVVDAIGGFFTQLGKDISAIWQGMKAAAKAVWDFIYGNIIKPYIDLITIEFNVLSAVFGYVFAVIRGLAIVAWDFIYNVAIKPVMALIKLEIQGLVNIFTAVWNTIVAVASAVWQFLWANVISPIINVIVMSAHFLGGIFSAVWGGISAGAQAVWNAISNAFHAAWGAVSGVWGGVAGWFGGVWNSIVRMASGIGGGIASAFSDAMNGAKNIVVGAVNWIIDRVNGVIHTVNNTAGKLPGVPHIGDIPHLASGGIVMAGGRVRVGEFGAEDVILPAGAQVKTATDTARAGGGGITLNVSVPVSNGTKADRQNYAVSIAQEIVTALRAQGLNINQMGSLR